MWIQLLATQRVIEKGIPITHYPGDWVEVGRQTALLWISRGEARSPGDAQYTASLPDDSGILILSDQPETPDNQHPARGILAPLGDQIDILAGAPCVPWRRTLLWSPDVKLRLEMVSVGLALLDVWQMAVPLWRYDQLACHIGDEEEQAATKAVIRDLRVPLYDTRLIFARRDNATKRLIEQWQARIFDGEHPQHAFLRLVYQSKPMILALPTTWTDPHAPR